MLLLAACILCYTGQTFFNKLFSMRYSGPEAAATPVYASLYGLVVGLVSLCLNGLSFSPSGMTLILGCINGVILFLYNLSMINAARSGPFAFQSIVMLFGSIVVCLVFSALWWGDRMTVTQLIGIAVMLAAFVLLNSGGLSFAGVEKGYFFWVTLLFFSNGIFGVLLDAQQRAMPGERNEMIIATFLSSAAVSLAYLFTAKRKLVSKAFKMDGRSWLFALLSAGCASFAVYLLMTLLQYIPSYILYTVNNGSILVLSVLLCAVVLKEKMTKKAVAGIALSVVSIVLLSL